MEEKNDEICHAISERCFCHAHNLNPPPRIFQFATSNLEKLKAVIQFLVQVERWSLKVQLYYYS